MATAVLAVGVAVTLAACGGDDSSNGDTGTMLRDNGVEMRDGGQMMMDNGQQMMTDGQSMMDGGQVMMDRGEALADTDMASRGQRMMTDGRSMMDGTADDGPRRDDDEQRPTDDGCGQRHDGKRLAG